MGKVGNSHHHHPSDDAVGHGRAAVAAMHELPVVVVVIEVQVLRQLVLVVV